LEGEREKKNPYPLYCTNPLNSATSFPVTPVNLFPAHSLFVTDNEDNIDNGVPCSWYGEISFDHAAEKLELTLR